MSHWGATVITNLMSAIPWVGQDIVEFIKNIKHESLGTIGVIDKNALKRGKRDLKIDKQKYLSIPVSFIAFLVGLIDGDGYIQIAKTGKGYIVMKLVISLHLKDLSTIEYIKSVLNLGRIEIYKDNLSPTCKLIINKTDLQDILFPLLIYHNIFFLTKTRIGQFNTAMYILINDIKLFNEIPQNSPPIFNIPVVAEDYVKLVFFRNWIVGFTMAEGSFFIKKNHDGCFTLTQRLHIELFEAIKIIFNTTRKLENTTISRFSVSSKADIQTVINFFSFSGLHPLVGDKLKEYLKWVEALGYSLVNQQISKNSINNSIYGLDNNKDL
jgi:hypothetical protein